MSFNLLLTRLTRSIREMVRNGRITERNLARLTGMSQPHVHNVLKGIRVLSPELADQIMTQLGITVFDLCSPDELTKAAGLGASRVPFSDLGIQDSGQNSGARESYTFAREALEGLRDPAVTCLEADPLMAPRFEGGDLALFDRDERSRTQLDRRSVYLVYYDEAVRVRYIRLGGNRLYLVAEDCLLDPLRWDFVSLADRNILEIVRGRIVWIARQVAPVAAEPDEEAGRNNRSAR